MEGDVARHALTDRNREADIGHRCHMLTTDHRCDPCALLGRQFCSAGASLSDGLGSALGSVLRVGLHAAVAVLAGLGLRVSVAILAAISLHVLAGGALFSLRTLGFFFVLRILGFFALDIVLGGLFVLCAGFF